EILEVTDEVRQLIVARAADYEIRKVARRAGMRTLLEDGIAKAAQGLTTIDEVLRVVSHGESQEPVHESRPVQPVAAAPVAPKAPAPAREHVEPSAPGCR